MFARLQGWPFCGGVFVALQLAVPMVAEIDTVTVRPGGVIRSSDAVSIVVGMVTPCSAGSLYRVSDFVISRGQVAVAVYPTWGLLTALDYVTEEVVLGPLAPGVYHYVVSALPDQIGFGEPVFVEGTFAVSPTIKSVTALTDGTIYLLWETAPGFVLESCRSLMGDLVWEETKVDMGEIGPLTSAVVTNSTAAAFFRLRYRGP